MKAHPRTYPVDEVLPELLHAFESANLVMLSAPPGAGKTTRVPIALLNHGILNNANILMLEPRRLAARRAAEFMSAQLEENVGKTIGYRIRGEFKMSPNTRIEIVTEGILTRMLQREPDLHGVGMIVFDEFHERSIHADLGLALAIDVQRHLRSDLRILIMSATLDTEHMTGVFGKVPFIESKGKLFPIDTRYSKFSSDKPVETRIVDAVQRALANDEGDILVFLPGWREIRRTEEALSVRKLPEEVILHTLHGESTVASQNFALAPAPSGKRKVILSTNVAESSLTIEGVRIVVDSGLVRAARFDPRRSMSGLVTLPASKASADQRRGRAGRLAPGVCYRLWTESEHNRLADSTQPEIKSADLAPLALNLALWGAPNAENLVFLDPPPSANLQQAQAVLRDLEAIDQNGLLTQVGRSMTELPIHPRFAHMIMRASALGMGGLACEIAALLEERDLFTGQKDSDVDLTSRWLELKNGRGSIRDKIISQSERLKEIAGITTSASDESKIGLLVAFAYPDRIGKRRDKEGNTYLLASGTTAALPAGSALARSEFLSVAEVDTVGTSIRVFLCAPVTKDELIESFGDKIIAEELVRWNATKKCVEARIVEQLGGIILTEKPIPHDDDRIVSAMVEGVQLMGLETLPWNKESQSLLERSEWIRINGLVSDEWPDLSKQALMGSLEKWLGPFLSGIRQQNQLSRLNLHDILVSLFSRRQYQELETLAPHKLRLPSGSSAVIDYSSGSKPVLEVRIQEMFGQTDTPRLGSGKVPVLIHLLSPAKRPLAVTQDLRSFWQNTYPIIRKQLRAKYPKHDWPDDPLRASPTNRTKRVLKGA